MLDKIVKRLRPDWIERVHYMIHHDETGSHIKQTFRGNEITQAEIDSVKDECALEQAKENKEYEIRTSFGIDSIKSSNIGGVMYQGGFDSAIKLDAAKRLAEAVGSKTVIFFDESNIARELSIAQAQDVIITVAGNFQTTLAKKQSLLIEIEKATSIEQVNKIIW